MNANEIRIKPINTNGFIGEGTTQVFICEMLQEIAAQLADLNTNLEWVICGGQLQVGVTKNN